MILEYRIERWGRDLRSRNQLDPKLTTFYTVGDIPWFVTALPYPYHASPFMKVASKHQRARGDALQTFIPFQHPH